VLITRLSDRLYVLVYHNIQKLLYLLLDFWLYHKTKKLGLFGHTFKHDMTHSHELLVIFQVELRLIFSFVISFTNIISWMNVYDPCDGIIITIIF